MTRQPGIWGRLVAAARGEVSTETLEAYRRAGSTVHDLLDAVERKRFDAKLAGLDPWRVDPATQAQLLYTWNAFVLQTLADKFLDADYAHDPTTAGFVPPITAEQADAFYREVPGWLSRARQAESNPAYRPDLPLPAELPPWKEVVPCPPPHLAAIAAATAAVRLHAEAAMALFEGEGLPPERQPAAQRLRQLMAEASAGAEYAERLVGGAVTQELHEQVEGHAQAAVERFYRLGQLLSMPDLLETADRASPGAVPSAGRPRAAPAGRAGEGFDPWRMTDPEAREGLKRDPRAKRAIDDMWRHDPDSARTLAIQAQVEAALERGDIAHAMKPNGQRVGHFMCTPYAPIYVARRPVTVAGDRLRPGQEFTVEVSAEGVLVGERFRREVVTGPFGPTPELDYCDPNVKGPHDD